MTVKLICVSAPLLLMLWAMPMLEVKSEFPDTRDGTSTLHEVKCVGVVTHIKTKSKCQGTFLTQKHMITSCRCIGHTNSTDGVFTKATPDEYEVQSWSKGTAETQGVAELIYYHHCGIEPNKVLLDLGVVITKGAFSEAAVVPADLPQAHVFRFYEYIYRLMILKTRCMTTSLDSPPGTVLNATVNPSMFCPTDPLCINNNRKKCQLLLLTTNHVCALPQIETPTAPTTSSPNPAPPTPQPFSFTKCAASAGAPLICHKLLVGINARSANCDEPYNSFMYMRMDYVVYWLMDVICDHK